MEDENAKSTGEKDEVPKRKITLKDATSLLKAEALRRYRQRHKSSLDRHEQALGDEFTKNGKKRKSPGPKSPTITEDAAQENVGDGRSTASPMEDDVFNRGSRAGSSVSRGLAAEEDRPLSAGDEDQEKNSIDENIKIKSATTKILPSDRDKADDTFNSDYMISPHDEDGNAFDSKEKRLNDVNKLPAKYGDENNDNAKTDPSDPSDAIKNYNDDEKKNSKPDADDNLITGSIGSGDGKVSDKPEQKNDEDIDDDMAGDETKSYSNRSNKGKAPWNKLDDDQVQYDKEESEKNYVPDLVGKEKLSSGKSVHDPSYDYGSDYEGKSDGNDFKRDSRMSENHDNLPRMNKKSHSQTNGSGYNSDDAGNYSEERDKDDVKVYGDTDCAKIYEDKDGAKINGDKDGAKNVGVKDDAKIYGDKDEAKIVGDKDDAKINEGRDGAKFDGQKDGTKFDGENDGAKFYDGKDNANTDGNKDGAKPDGDKIDAKRDRNDDGLIIDGDEDGGSIDGDKVSVKIDEDDAKRNSRMSAQSHSTYDKHSAGTDRGITAPESEMDEKDARGSPESRSSGQQARLPSPAYYNRGLDDIPYRGVDYEYDRSMSPSDKMKYDFEAKSEGGEESDLSSRTDDRLAQTFPLPSKPRKKRGHLSSAALLDGLLGPGNGSESESQLTEKSEEESQEEPAQETTAEGDKPSEEMDQKADIGPPITETVPDNGQENVDNTVVPAENTKQSEEPAQNADKSDDIAQGAETQEEGSAEETPAEKEDVKEETQELKPEQEVSDEKIEQEPTEAAQPQEGKTETKPEQEASDSQQEQTESGQESTESKPDQEQSDSKPEPEQSDSKPDQEQSESKPSEAKPSEETTESKPASDGKEESKPATDGEQEQESSAAKQEHQETYVDKPQEEDKPQVEAPSEGATQQQQQEETSETKEGKEEGTEEQEQEKDAEKSQPVDGEDPNIRGDEDEVQSQEIIGNEEEEKIPDDFFYNFDDHMSKPLISDESGLPVDMLKLHHSYGYDCQKRANLHILDNDTALFAAGNLAQLINFKTKEQTYLRSTSGGGLGAIAVHPSKKYFAIGEKGVAPNINIFEYPSLKLYRILRGGTQESYSFVDFSPDGKLLASVGGDPDFMLTLWDWKQEKTVLRSKAFSQDVFRVTFSTELDGQLTSSGTGHIRFWKMAKTFTGLKLQGQLGKFGKTEISDIEGYVELPDGKVLSGSETGNLMLWDGGLIKVEISRKNKKPCHQGVIQQIIMDEGELMTVGADGYIRVWDFETVDTADVTDEAAVFEMEPMNELKVGNGVSLRSIVKSADAENEPTMWYAQDANGAIWKLDLSFSFTSQEPDKLMKYHAGQINGCAASPISDLVATTGQDNFVFVYDYVSQTQLCRARYNSPGTALLWAPQVVDPKGATILAGFADGVVRILVFQKKEVIDVHGRKKQNQSELALKQAFKPHNKNIVCMVVDSKGELLATGSDDSTVFFFTIGDNYEPIGFIKTPSAVTHMEWSPSKFKKQTLIVSCVNGEVMEIASPEAGKFDTAHTFEIIGLNIRTHQFKSVKSHLRHEEELERKAKEEEERKKREEEERRKRIERGQETESEQGDQPEEKKQDEEWQPYIPTEPSPILHAMHGSEEGKFWLSMGEFDAGYLYECQFEDEETKKRLDDTELYEPIKSLPMTGSSDVPVKSIKFTKNNNFAVMGLQNGSIRVQPVTDGDLSDSTAHWTISSHDNQYGQVTHIEMSHDNKYIFSVGADGNFFVYEFMDQEKIEEKVKEAKAKIPSARKELAEKAVNDIEDPHAYSIEDAKQKAEHDKMVKLAEQKKATVRKTIKQMRDQFKTLIDKNTELPQHLRLDRKEFEMDPEIKRELARHTQEKIEIVKKEMAWEEEKHRIALEKLKIRFKDVVECERIVVKAIHTPHEVSSFRASKLPDDFYQAKANMDKRKTTMFSKDGESRQQTQDLLQGIGKDAGKEGTEREDTATRVTTTLKGSMGERITKSLLKVEEKKKKRAARRAQWAELYSSKPDDNYEDPADVATIKDAQENMGDYKLKSADDYVVPDHLRMNTDKARARLLMLKDLLHKHKYDFNQQLLSLRDKKIGNIDKIKELRYQLEVVQSKLASEHQKPVPDVPRLYPEEIPERKYEYTRETLLKFKAEIQVSEKEKGQQKQNTGFGGFNANSELKASAFTPSPVRGLKDRQAAAQIEDTMFELTPYAAESVQTELELKLQQAEEIRLLYEQDRILKEINDIILTFDAELKCLRHDKFKLDVNLKNADLRHVTLFEEFLLLRDFEKHENVLVSKLESKQQEKFDMQERIVQVQAKIESKKKDIEKLVEREKALQTTFVASLGDNNKFLDYLTKVFKKKIKRSKKKATDGEEDEDEDSEEESSDESDFEESDEESDSEAGGYDLDICPPGCDQNMYDNTCALREKRLDIEEALAEMKKDRDACNKEHESFTKKSKIIDGAVKQAENELEAFQLEKQRKLNELDVVVQLKLHQIQHTINNQLPQDLSQCLVFEQPGVIRLTHRIKELEQEKGIQKKQMREAKRKHVTLIKDRKLFDGKIGEMKETTDKMMIQKFGKIVDLEKLETVTVNRQVEELKEKLRVAEIQCSTDVIKWNEKISNAKDNITDQIKENTNKLDQLNMLIGEKKEFETALDSRQKNLGDEYGGVRKSDVNERQRLIQLVHLQAQEIEALKEEITLLSRKGGHILPPAQPPLPQSSQGNRGSLPPN